ncbi:hypothetical protein HPB51_024339 [Rhipicephalus microplus]|uniref:Uncharacterized protein n=1 Tax=Rhipicephalus microplus TaxID=6941 RepID=A0A9J6EDH4_RHIMP|nr:hypothetical protein HPB51_024339 [Rhipicephalus microplus]
MVAYNCLKRPPYLTGHHVGSERSLIYIDGRVGFNEKRRVGAISATETNEQRTKKIGTSRWLHRLHVRFSDAGQPVAAELGLHLSSQFAAIGARPKSSPLPSRLSDWGLTASFTRVTETARVEPESGFGRSEQSPTLGKNSPKSPAAELSRTAVQYWKLQALLNGKPKEDQHDQGVWTVAHARSSPSVKPTTTTYTVTSALCSVPEEVLKTCMAAAAPRMATGDVEPVPPRVPDRPVFDDKDGGKPDPEVLSQGEGLQQKPNRGLPPVPAVESLQASAFDSNLASLDTAKYNDHDSPSCPGRLRYRGLLVSVHNTPQPPLFRELDCLALQG